MTMEFATTPMALTVASRDVLAKRCMAPNRRSAMREGESEVKDEFF